MSDKFSIYYIEGKKGWTTPFCNGYPAQPITDESLITYNIGKAVLEGETIKVSVAHGLGDYSDAPKLYIALYGEGNELITVHTKGVNEELVDYPFDISPFSGVETIKVFLWETLKPISDIRDLPVL